MLIRNVVTVVIVILGALGVVYLTVDYMRSEDAPMEETLVSLNINEDESNNNDVPEQVNENPVNNDENDFKISSESFENLGELPVKFTCDGENINPALKIENIPYGTQSLVLIVEDPDAKSKTWVHWLLYNIDPNIGAISEAFKPTNEKTGMNDFGQDIYGSPCPPEGQPHRYFFHVYALNKTLEDLESGLRKEELIELMNDHIVDQATMMATYKKLSQ